MECIQEFLNCIRFAKSVVKNLQGFSHIVLQKNTRQIANKERNLSEIMTLRIMNLRRRKLRLKDICKTKSQLVRLRRAMLIYFEAMGLSRSKLRNVGLRFGKDHEFIYGDNAFLDITDNEIVVKRGMNFVEMLGSVSHEYGHEVTKFGRFRVFQKAYSIDITIFRRHKFIIGKRVCNILGEISAYNFEKEFLETFCKIRGNSIKINNGEFWESIKSSPTHYISRVFKWIPLGNLIKKEYLA